MSEASRVRSVDPHAASPTLGQAVPVARIDEARCALCGTSLVGKRQYCRLVSPFGGGRNVTACRACRRAVLGEGYRPA